LFEVLALNAKTYYKCRHRKVDQDYSDYLDIYRIFEKSKKTYGYRRITYALLRNEGIVMNHKKVSRIMKKYGLVVQHAQVSNSTKLSRQRHEANIVENYLKRQFKFPKKNQAWVTDITYLVFGNQRRYLSTILDLHSRKVVSYKISHLNSNELVYNTLHEALSKEKEVSGCILHSDQGHQYTSKHYQVICQSHGIITSMSRKGNPLDNAVIESFHSLLKKETLYTHNFKSIEDYVQSVINWIDFYNRDRIRLSQTKSRHVFI
jgi:putative transposase